MWSVSGLVECAQQPAEALRSDEEGFELHRSAAFRALDVNVEAALEELLPWSPSGARFVRRITVSSG